MIIMFIIFSVELNLFGSTSVELSNMQGNRVRQPSR